MLARAKRRLTHAFIDRGIFRHALEERLKRDMIRSQPTAPVPAAVAKPPQQR
jgi:hypothetical protein